MYLKKLKKTIIDSWNWIWNSDSFLSWIVALIVIYIIVKYIFFPGLSLILGTSLPIAGVESSSMDHSIIKDEYNRLYLCSREFYKKESINFDKYWDSCGEWYENTGISKKYFKNFPLSNGFRKGDIVFVWGRFTPIIGDIIIFKPAKESLAPRPIVHRIVKINNISADIVFQTKGDHNKEQLTYYNNQYKTDETNIKKEQIIGKVVFKIPYLGWLKIWLTEIINMILGV
jgi:signal peptidase I